MLKMNEKILCFLVGVVIIILGLGIYILYKILSKEVSEIYSMGKISNSNFEESVKYLMFIIEYVTKTETNILFKKYIDSKSSDQTLLNKEDFSYATTQCVYLIKNYISNDYKNNLCQFVNPENYDKFIESLVYNKLLVIVDSINQNIIYYG